MKKLFRLSVLAALPLMLFGCKSDTEQPKLNFENGLRTETLAFEAEGGNQSIAIVAVGNWTVTNNNDWIAVDKSKGKGNATIKVTVNPNENTNTRSGIVTFKLGSLKATLTVNQNGEGMGNALYIEDCGPAASANTAADAYTGYIRGGSLDQSGVTYASTQGTAIRNSQPATANGFSGPALVFMGNGTNFQIKNINVTGNNKLVLKFGAGLLVGTYGVDQHLVVPDATTLKVEVGYNGTLYAAVPFTAQQEGDSWSWVTAPFSVANGTTSIYVKITVLTAEGGRIDDFSIIAGGNGSLIDPQPETSTVIDPTALYYETFPTAISANSALEGYVFDRGGVLSQSAVTYTSTQSTPIRNSTPPTSGIGTSFSGIPILYLNGLNGGTPPAAGNTLTIGKINVTGNQNLTLKFAAGVKAGSDASAAFMVPTANEIKLQVGYDGTNWADVAFTGQMVGSNNWCLMTAPFKIAAGKTEIYVKFTAMNTYNVGVRIDDFQIIPGGNGTEIQPGGGSSTEPTTKKTIAEVRTAAAVNADWYLEGTVVSDQSAAGQNLQAYQIVLQDATTANSGIMINGASGVDFTGYAVGTKVRVNLNHAAYTPYNGLAQITGVLAADVTTTTNGTAITAPTTITVAQLRTGQYESMLVQIANVELVIKSAQAMNSGSSGNNGNILVMSDPNQFTMRTATRATFKDSNAPLGKGTLIGIAGIYTTTPATPANADFQISPRTMVDVAGMAAGASDYFTVTPSATKEVTAAAGTFDITVSANVAWTAVSSDPANFALSTAGATGNGTITVTYTANASTAQTRSCTIMVATTASVTPASYPIAVTQAKAAAGGGTDVDYFKIYTLTEGATAYASAGNQHINITNNFSRTPTTAEFDLTYGIKNGSGTPANSLTLGANSANWANISLGSYATEFTPLLPTFNKAAALVNTTVFSNISKILVAGSADSNCKIALLYKPTGGSWTAHTAGAQAPGYEFTFAAPVSGQFAIVEIVTSTSGNARVQNVVVTYTAFE